MRIGFDNDKYLAMQSAHIRERIAQFDNKLYLEFGGKLFDDYHASRVLPGFQPDSKLQMLLQLKEQAEVVIVISAEDIVANKMRGDYGITYDVDVLRLIETLIQSTTPPGAQSADPFWQKSETALLQALVLYLMHEAPKEGTELRHGHGNAGCCRGTGRR